MEYQPLIAFVITFVALWSSLRFGFLSGFQDMPNQRSLHKKPVPRIGGLMLIAGIVAAGALLWPMPGWAVWVPMVALVAVSLIDDKHNIRARWRFLAHIGAAACFVVFSMETQAPWLMLVILLGVIWATNLYNFMDGSDGLAGGMALFGFGTYGVASLLHGDTSFAMFAFCIAGSALAFLVFNFHPARVFMGDAGSIPLGFLAAALGLLGIQRGLWPFWFPVLVFSPFAVDATVTLARRVLRGEKPWKAHREHFYQRLVQLGWGHRKTALSEYCLMLIVSLSALACMDRSIETQWTMLAIWVALYISMGRAIEVAWRRRSTV